MRFFVLYGIIPDKGYCNFVRVSEIKGVQNLSNTTTPWVCAKKAYTQGVDIMLIVSKHAEGMSLRYAVPEACRYVMRCRKPKGRFFWLQPYLISDIVVVTISFRCGFLCYMELFQIRATVILFG